MEAAHAGSMAGGFILPILIFLAAAVVAVPLFRFAGMGAVVGYLAAGIAIGPSGLGLIHDPEAVLHIAEIGVVLLLFIIGLELKPSRLMAMRRDITLLGSGQMLLSAFVVGIVLVIIAGYSWRAAVVAGVALAFSSTAIAVQLLNERSALETPYGRRSFSILLYQDVMVAPVLALIPLMAGARAAAGGWDKALLAFGGVVAAFAIVIFAGRYVLNPLFSLLARTGAREVMTAAALLVVLGAAFLMQWAGMSMALGAFMAGLLLSESHFRHELEANIEPFRGLLMGLFFMSVGMSLDGKIVAESAVALAFSAIGLIAVKGLIVYGLLRWAGCNNCDAIAGASVLTMAGEFAFVVFPVAVANGIVDTQQAALLAALTALTMIVSPLLAKLCEKLADRWRPAEVSDLPAETIPDEAKGNVLVIGFGRFGQLAVQVLLAGRANVTVIDKDVERIKTALRFGFKVYYGDGSRLDVLRAAGADEAQVLAVCIDDAEVASTIVDMAKQNFPLTKTFVRAYDRIHALALIEAGADHFERETAEAALVFGGAVYASLHGDRQRASELVEATRKRDIERLARQQSEGLIAGARTDAITPEPLVNPYQQAKALSEETAQVTAEPDTPAPALDQKKQEPDG